MGKARQFNEENEHVVCIKIPSKSQTLETMGLWTFLYFSNNYKKKKHFCNEKNQKIQKNMH